MGKSVYFKLTGLYVIEHLILLFLIRLDIICGGIKPSLCNYGGMILKIDPDTRHVKKKVKLSKSG